MFGRAYDEPAPAAIIGNSESGRFRHDGATYSREDAVHGGLHRPGAPETAMDEWLSVGDEEFVGPRTAIEDMGTSQHLVLTRRRQVVEKRAITSCAGAREIVEITNEDTVPRGART